MKKTLAILLAIIMLIPMFTVLVSAAPDEANSGVAGITFDGDLTYGANEEYHFNQNLEKVPHTLSAWVYLDDDAYSNRNVIFGNYPSNTRYTGYMHFEINASHQPRFKYSDADQSSKHEFVFTDITVEKNTWTLVTVTVDETAGEVRCYINGELAGTMTEGFAPIDPTVINYPFMLGGFHYRNGSAFNKHYFKGEMKDFYAYADTRTASEIAADYANGPALGNPDLICAYDIDANDQGKDIADESGNGYTLYYNKLWLTEEEMEVLRGDTSDRAYSFAVVPDTQYLTEWHQEALPVLYQWIVDNVEERNIQYVIGLGDITNTDTNIDAISTSHGVKEWETTYNAISKMNGVVPYSLIRGNHDVYSTEPKDTATPDLVGSMGQGFIQYFGGDSFYAQQFKNPDGYEAGYYQGTLANYKGVEETDEVANTWRTLEADGDKWLLMNLDWGAHDDVLAWAGEIIEAHPDHRVIISTHNYLGRSGDHTDNRLSGDVTSSYLQKGFNNGDGIWNKLVSRYSNIEMVLSGHISSSSIIVKQNEGVYGNTVTQMLIDGQDLDRYWYNPEAGKITGVGLVAMLYVSKDGTHVDTEYYSTVTGKYLSSMSQRTVDLNAECDTPDTKWDGKSQFAPVGSGTEEDPYLISCAENLAWMAKKCNYVASTLVNPFAGMYFEQVCDIDMNGHKLSQIGCYYDSTSKMAVFGGTYDGKGFSISNGTIDKHSSSAQNQKWGVGIFGNTYEATIKNVVADNLTVSGLTRVGVIVGYARDTYITNCVSTDTCAVIGTGTPTTLASTSSVFKTEQWNVFSQNRLGGIVGHFYGSSYKFQINYCKSGATILAKGNNALAGGIVGSLENQINMYYNVFDGRIINDFTDEGYNRTLAGENVNGGIVGYIGSGTYTMAGTNRYISYNVNKGSFELLGVATTDVVYGGIVGAVKDITPSNYRIEYSYNLSNDIDLNTDKYTQTKAVYIGGIVGRVTNDKASTARSLKLANCGSVSTGISNGGLNVDTTAFTVDNLYVCNTVAEGGTAPVTHVLPNGVTTGTVDVATKELSALQATTDKMEKTYADERKAGRRTDVLNTIGYQTATAENDNRVRLVFGLDTLELYNYGYELTLTYTENGEIVTKKASLTDRVVYTDVQGNEKNYNAKTDYGYEYFATLVIDPTVSGKAIEGEAVCTVSAYTLTEDGYKLCYGEDLITLVFTDGVLTKPVTNID
ncbi:MAG: metallophosphoesterase [Clostridia bacterium]|nr:metallophosphoesterase [Clostridia bacterium]